MVTATDPICQMDVDVENPPGGQSDYQGTTYYFCALGCKAAFDKEPEKYAPEVGTSSGGRDQHRGYGGCVAERKPRFFARLFGRK